MSFTWATVDRDFSDRPHYLHKSLSHLWGRKIYYDFTKNDKEHTLQVLKVSKSRKQNTKFSHTPKNYQYFVHFLP